MATKRRQRVGKLRGKEVLPLSSTARVRSPVPEARGMTSVAIKTRQRMYDEGLRPVPPLPDGRDLWIDDDLVYAYTTDGRVLAVMLCEEYIVVRKKIYGL